MLFVLFSFSRACIFPAFEKGLCDYTLDDLEHYVFFLSLEFPWVLSGPKKKQTLYDLDILMMSKTMTLFALWHSVSMVYQYNLRIENQE